MNHLYHVSDHSILTITADYLDWTQQTIFGFEITNRNKNKNCHSFGYFNATDLYELSIDS